MCRISFSLNIGRFILSGRFFCVQCASRFFERGTIDGRNRYTTTACKTWSNASRAIKLLAILWCLGGRRRAHVWSAQAMNLWEQTQANHWQAFLGCLAVLAVPWILKTSDFPHIFRVLRVCLPACCPRFVSSQFLRLTQNQRHWTCDLLRPSSSMAALMKPQWNKLGRMQSKKERLGIRKSKEFRESRHPWIPSGKLT